MHFNKMRSSHPADRASLTASSISAMLAMPVEMITGFPVAATARIRARSVFSNEAILYAGTCSDSRNSTAVASKGVLNATSPSWHARSKMGACHSHGVCARS